MFEQGLTSVVAKFAPVQQIEQGAGRVGCFALADDFVELLAEPVDISGGHHDVQLGMLGS